MNISVSQHNAQELQKSIWPSHSLLYSFPPKTCRCSPSVNSSTLPNSSVRVSSLMLSCSLCKLADVRTSLRVILQCSPHYSDQRTVRLQRATLYQSGCAKVTLSHTDGFYSVITISTTVFCRINEILISYQFQTPSSREAQMSSNIIRTALVSHKNVD